MSKAKQNKNDTLTNEQKQWVSMSKKCVENIKNVPNNCIPVILSATGTFSPIHRMHIINMDIAKYGIESLSNNKYYVIGGFLSPTHDSYCKRKLGINSYIKGIHRCNIIRNVLKDNKYWYCDDWHTKQKYMQSINAEVGNIENMINFVFKKDDMYKRIKIFYVCGSDLAVKCGFDYDGFGRYGVAIIQRNGDLINKNSGYHFYEMPVYIIDVPNKYKKWQNASSTDLRKLISNNKSIKDITFDEVESYMIEHNILGAKTLKNDNNSDDSNDDNNSDENKSDE